MFLSEIDGRGTRRVIRYLTYFSAGFVLNSVSARLYDSREGSSRKSNKLFAHLVQQYYLASLFLFTSVIIVRLHDADRQIKSDIRFSTTKGNREAKTLVFRFLTARLMISCIRGIRQTEPGRVSSFTDSQIHVSLREKAKWLLR